MKKEGNKYNKFNILITVIIPIYNVEKYLKKCLDSVINQTYNNLEIILIDDGSTDDSGLICDKYSKEDSRIIVEHIKNAGVSNARNIGIKKAKGEYITFVDSDDYIELNMYEKMISVIANNEYPDIISCGFFSENEQKDFLANSNETLNEVDILNNNIAFKEIFTDKIGAYIWNKLFKKNIIVLNSLLFDKRISYGEDLLFLCHFVDYSKKICCMKEKLYHHIKRKDSITNTKFNKKLLSILDAYSKVEKIGKKKYNDSIENIIISKSFVICNLIYKIFVTEKIKYKRELEELRQILKEDKKNYIKLKKKNIKIFIIVSIITCNITIGCIIWYLYKKIKKVKYD